jgi:cysteine desulfuration protein SufE
MKFPTLRERQDRFIDDMAMFDNWTDRFNHLLSLSEELPAEFPDYLLQYRIVGCQSKTCFLPRIHDGLLYIKGWSNSAIMGGIIVAMTAIFNFTNRDELRHTELDFHIKSELFDNLTQMRRAALEEMIRRINVLYAANR